MTSCALGEYIQNNSCVDCEAGSFGNATDLTSCYECSPGTFSNTNGSTSCTICPVNYYQPDYRSMYCLQCDEGLVAEPGSSSCDVPTSAPTPNSRSLEVIFASSTGILFSIMSAALFYLLWERTKTRWEPVKENVRKTKARYYNI